MNDDGTGIGGGDGMEGGLEEEKGGTSRRDDYNNNYSNNNNSNNNNNNSASNTEGPPCGYNHPFINIHPSPFIFTPLPSYSPLSPYINIYPHLGPPCGYEVVMGGAESFGAAGLMYLGR